MAKIHEIIYKWISEGRKPITMSQLDMDVLVRVMTGESRSFINSNVKALLDRCKVNTIPDGIGWRLA